MCFSALLNLDFLTQKKENMVTPKGKTPIGKAKSLTTPTDTLDFTDRGQKTSN